MSINQDKTIAQLDIKNGDYIISDLFFYRDIKHGELLSTSEGFLKNQTDRASVFVPPGGGLESKPVFEKIKVDKQSIILKKTDTDVQIEYILFNFTKQDGALIIKKEKGLLPDLIKYSGTENMFEKKDLSDFFSSDIITYLNKTTHLSVESNFLHIFCDEKTIDCQWIGDKFQIQEKE